MNRLAVAALCAVACSSRSAVEVAPLESRLSLHLAVREIRIAEPTPVEAVLQNRSDLAADICLVDTGVSIWMRMPLTDQMVPVEMYGTATHMPCWRRLHLGPGESLAFSQTPVFPREWVGAADSVTLGALIRVKAATDHNSMGDGVSTIHSQEGPVHVSRS